MSDIKITLKKRIENLFFYTIDVVIIVTILLGCVLGFAWAIYNL